MKYSNRRGGRRGPPLQKIPNREKNEFINKKELPVGNSFQPVEKLVFDRLAEVNKGPKASNSTPKCMWILERGELRSKAKPLRSKRFLFLLMFCMITIVFVLKKESPKS